MSPEALIVGLIVGAPLGYVGRAWWRARQKSRRLAAVYDRHSSEPVTVVVAAARPPRRPLPKAWVGWQSRSPTRMNLPAVCPRDDADDQLWMRSASRAVSLSLDEPLTLPLTTDDVPVRLAEPGGRFGGAGASGGWQTSGSSPAADPEPVTIDSTPASGPFGSDP